VDTLFDEMDENGSGEIEYEELNKALRVGAGLLARGRSASSLTLQPQHLRHNSSAMVERERSKRQQPLARVATAKRPSARSPFSAESLASSPHFPNRSSHCPLLRSSSHPPSPPDASPIVTPALATPRVTAMPLAPLVAENWPWAVAMHRRPRTTEHMRRPASLDWSAAASRRRPATSMASLNGQQLPPPPAFRYAFHNSPSGLRHVPGGARPLSPWMRETITSINARPQAGGRDAMQASKFAFIHHGRSGLTKSASMGF